ncbi:MAG: hypothetical protein OXH16_10595 [Gemmatimonadetes bacterium]|nr:hypothetical protein [Gemmatimonadota bacterium]
MIIPGKRHPLIWLTVMALIVAGCGSSLPKHVLRLTPDTLQNRVLQTRKYEGISETDLLSASTGVIQDLGFIINESETNLGFIVGSKNRDAPPDATQRTGQVLGTIAQIFLAATIAAITQDEDAFDLVDIPAVDDYQKLWASVVIRPTSEDNDKTHYVRVTFQRIVWNTDDKIDRMESLDEPEMYQKFFDLLSKSVFLEGQKI